MRGKKWRPNLRPARCEYCGKQFQASRKWSRFDTEKCRKAYHRDLVEKALRDYRRRHGSKGPE